MKTNIIGKGITSSTRPHVEDDRTGISVEAIKRAFLDHLCYTLGRYPTPATPNDLYMALAYTVRDRLLHRWMKTVESYMRQDVKVVSYLSAEFLMGPQLGNNLMQRVCAHSVNRCTARSVDRTQGSGNSLWDNARPLKTRPTPATSAERPNPRRNCNMNKLLALLAAGAFAISTGAIAQTPPAVPAKPAAAAAAKLEKPASVAQADWDKMSEADKKKAVDKAMADAKKAAAPAAPAAAAKPAKKGGC